MHYQQPSHDNEWGTLRIVQSPRLIESYFRRIRNQIHRRTSLFDKRQASSQKTKETRVLGKCGQRLHGADKSIAGLKRQPTDRNQPIIEREEKDSPSAERICAGAIVTVSGTADTAFVRTCNRVRTIGGLRDWPLGGG